MIQKYNAINRYKNRENSFHDMDGDTSNRFFKAFAVSTRYKYLNPEVQPSILI